MDNPRIEPTFSASNQHQYAELWERSGLHRQILTQMIDVLTTLTAMVQQQQSDIASMRSMIDNAVAAALAAGVTEAELQAMNELSARLQPTPAAEPPPPVPDAAP